VFFLKKKMKISEIAKLLPRLGSFDRDIESWTEDSSVFFLKKKKMKISEIAKLLPRLGSFDRDIESWTEEFNRVTELSDIEDPRKIFAWAKECVPGRLKGVIEDLKEEDEKAEMNIYPSITDIKTAIEKFLDITPQE